MVLEKLVVHTMYLDEFGGADENAHQLHSKCLHMIILADVMGELDHLLHWLALCPMLPPLKSAIVPDSHEGHHLVIAICKVSPTCVYESLMPSLTR